MYQLGSGRIAPTSAAVEAYPLVASAGHDERDGLCPTLYLLSLEAKGASVEAQEHLEKVDTLVVDKTGTLTEGRPAVVAVVPTAGHDEAEVLRLTASMVRSREHPLSLAILRDGGPKPADRARRGLRLADRKGVLGIVEGGRALLGNSVFIAKHDIDTTPLGEQADRPRYGGAIVIFIALDG